MNISNKTQSMRLFTNGCFGNKLKIWHSFEELKNNPPSQNVVVMRYKGLGNGFCQYDVNIKDVEKVMKNWMSKGAERNKIFFNETADDTKLLIQGEIMELPEGLYMIYSTLKEKMRTAIAKDPHHCIGLKVKMMLQYYLFPSSYEDLMILLEEYPNHAVEFSAWNMCVGDNQNRNAIVWEVRDY